MNKLTKVCSLTLQSRAVRLGPDSGESGYIPLCTCFSSSASSMISSATSPAATAAAASSTATTAATASVVSTTAATATIIAAAARPVIPIVSFASLAMAASIAVVVVAAFGGRSGRRLDWHDPHFVAVVVEALNFQFLGRYSERAGNRHLHQTDFFPLKNLFALLVEQVLGHVDLATDVERANRLAMSGQLQQPHDFDAHALGGLYVAGRPAVRAILIDASLQRWTDALPRHLDDAERRCLEDLRSRLDRV